MTSPKDAIPQKYELRLPQLTATAGESVYVPLQMAPVSDFFAAGVTIKYDAKVLRAVKVMPVPNSVYHEAKIAQKGEIRFAFVSAKPINSISELLMIEFHVMPNTEGKISPLLISDAHFSNSISISRSNGLIEVLPAKTALLANYPNPFNPETWMPYSLKLDANVMIMIYNIKGTAIRTLDLGSQKAGFYISKEKSAYWDGKDSLGEKVASGLYFYQLKAGDFSATRRMVIVK